MGVPGPVTGCGDRVLLLGMGSKNFFSDVQKVLT